MNNGDILLWPDGFWCFRDEYRKKILRGENYRVLEKNGPEWLVTSSQPVIARAS